MWCKVWYKLLDFTRCPVTGWESSLPSPSWLSFYHYRTFNFVKWFSWIYSNNHSFPFLLSRFIQWIMLTDFWMLNQTYIPVTNLTWSKCYPIFFFLNNYWFSPITSWQTDGETMETPTDVNFSGSKITANGDCSHEINRRLLNSAVATGLEKVSFHSKPKERQCQRILKLPHNCSHLTY